MDRLDPTALTLLLTAVVVAVLALLAAGVALRRLHVLDRRLARGAGGTADGAGGTAGEHLDALETEVARLRDDVAGALRHVAVVRYDAFGDMGGRMSFSAAFLDDAGDGVVVSSIHARGESRTYGKAVVGGDSDVVLTPEERQALDAARSGRVD